MTTPVSIISGFLGAGKTTLLGRILADPQGLRYGVLVNDFGDLDIDADLIAESHPDRIALSNGCVCCTIRDDLLAAALGLAGERPPPDHVLIETSGVSNPIAVAEVFFREPGSTAFDVDGIFCLIDGENFPDLDFESSELAIEQAAVADIVLLNKADLAAAEDLDRIERTLLGALPAMRLLRSVRATVPRQILHDPERRPGEAMEAATERPPDRAPIRDTHGHDHGSAFDSWSWRTAAPLSLPRFRRVVADLPNGVYRAKGILRFVEAPGQRGIFQLVGKRSSLEFEADPSAADASSLVAIGRHGAYDADALGAAFEACIATTADAGTP